jgi:hypothetical protein
MAGSSSMKKFENQRIAGFGYFKNPKEPIIIFILKEPMIFIDSFHERIDNEQAVLWQAL